MASIMQFTEANLEDKNGGTIDLLLSKSITQSERESNGLTTIYFEKQDGVLYYMTLTDEDRAKIAFPTPIIPEVIVTTDLGTGATAVWTEGTLRKELLERRGWEEHAVEKLFHDLRDVPNYNGTVEMHNTLFRQRSVMDY